MSEQFWPFLDNQVQWPLICSTYYRIVNFKFYDTGSANLANHHLGNSLQGRKQLQWILLYVHSLRLIQRKLELVLNKLYRTSAAWRLVSLLHKIWVYLDLMNIRYISYSVEKEVKIIFFLFLLNKCSPKVRKMGNTWCNLFPFFFFFFLGGRSNSYRLNLIDDIRNLQLTLKGLGYDQLDSQIC